MTGNQEDKIVKLLEQILDQLRQDSPRLLKNSGPIRAKRFNR
tara:strand:- start:457 stop:582 length:126 start_codon:yes stop_codon:yes gene_type:complete